MSLSFNLKRKNGTENKTTHKKCITLKNQQNYANIQHNIDTTEINDLSDNEVKFLGENPLHLSQRLSRLVREKSKKNKDWIRCWGFDRTSFFNVNIKIDKTDNEKRENAIFDQIIKQLPTNNDKFYIDYDKKSRHT